MLSDKKGIGGSGGRRIMVTAHLDEIGLMVKVLTKRGLSLSQILGVWTARSFWPRKL